MNRKYLIFQIIITPFLFLLLPACSSGDCSWEGNVGFQNEWGPTVGGDSRGCLTISAQENGEEVTPELKGDYASKLAFASGLKKVTELVPGDRVKVHYPRKYATKRVFEILSEGLYDRLEVTAEAQFIDQVYLSSNPGTIIGYRDYYVGSYTARDVKLAIYGQPWIIKDASFHFEDPLVYRDHTMLGSALSVIGSFRVDEANASVLMLYGLYSYTPARYEGSAY